MEHPTADHPGRQQQQQSLSLGRQSVRNCSTVSAVEQWSARCYISFGIRSELEDLKYDQNNSNCHNQSYQDA
ncbi:hypothetical protein TYRP_006468 [Tyrophagus putrescentiae]|nr:hypothetical protein TYRP_006468 [Tyrophagus putrescentiae]